MKITLSPDLKNSTPAVISALSKIKDAGGGELHFEKGEYHFYKEGTLKAYYAVTNNSAGEKHIVFPIIDMENVTVDGHDSVFVFHNIVFPFMISRSRGISLKNFLTDTGMSPVVNFKLHDFSDDGFYMDIDREETPFHVDNGSINFERENGLWIGKKNILSLHAVNRHAVQYMATGATEANTENLAAPLMKCDVSETPTGIYAKYQADTPHRCRFMEEPVSVAIDGGRSVDVICIDRSEDICVKDVTVARGIAMGILGQLSSNICIDNFSTDVSYHKNAKQTLTADAMHFVHCDGKLEIKNCKISDSMDDALNVHGMYTVVNSIDENSILSSIKHHEQAGFNPYRKNDRLKLVDNTTFEIVAEFIVETSEFTQNSNRQLQITGNFTYGKDKIKEGYLIENPDRMPDLHLHHNAFHNFPRNRVSGAGNMVIEENVFTNCNAGLLCLDLAPYWYESGRIKNLVIRNNVFRNCNKTGCEAFIMIGIDGFDANNAPKIHERIEISENTFTDIRGLAIISGGVHDLVLENNTFDCNGEPPVRIF